MKQLVVEAIGFHSQTNIPGVLLKDMETGFVVLISIGPPEYFEIDYTGSETARKRPRMATLYLEGMFFAGYLLERVTIDSLEDNIFYATLHFSDSETGIEHLVDSRPSDAIVLSLYAEKPIFMDEGVFKRVAMPINGDERRFEQKRFEDFVKDDFDIGRFRQ